MDIGGITFGGLATGLDTKTIIEALLKVEQQPIDRLESRKSTFDQKKSALDDLRSALSTFGSAVQGLTSDVTFLGRTATVSDEGYLGATAGSGAEAGLYSIEIGALAAAHKIRSDGFAAPDQGLVPDGTITIKAGGNETITIDVSAAAGNNSLEAIRDQINAADKGVAASVLYDGTSYRLIVRSEDSGLANAMTVTDTTGLNLDDPGNLVTSAADASVTVDGLEITSSTNTVTGVIPGVTLNLRAVTTGTPVTVEVTEDREGTTKAIQSLVTSFNQLMDFFSTQFDRDNPGVLAGDATAQQAQSEVLSLVTGGVEGLPANALIRSLSSIGVSFDGKTGKMSLDTSQLQLMLEDHFDDVGKLFSAWGKGTDRRVSYSSAAPGTAPGDYAVTLTTAAEQAMVTGSQALGDTLGRDETLDVTVGSTTASAVLTSGMTRAQVVDALNAALRSAGAGATASLDAENRLQITSREFGSGVALSVQSSQADSGAGTGFGSTAATDTGVDAAGMIGGVAATGIGQILIGAEGGDYAGLSLRITATPAEVAAAGGTLDLGSFSYSQGLLRALTSRIDSLVRTGEGPIDAEREGLTESIKRISDDITAAESRLASRRAYWVKMFTAAEQAIAQLQAQQARFSSILG